VSKYKRAPETFHIFYAWAEGPWHGRLLSESLKRAGFDEAPSAEATVLIAHSIGSYLIQPTDKNKIILLIGPPYWPGKSITRMLLQKVWQDRDNLSFIYWLNKLLWNSVYIVSKPILSIKSWEALHIPDPFAEVSERAIVIQNDKDVFVHPQLKNHIKQKRVPLSGQHDDCWHNPEPYIKLIQTEYKAL